MRTLRLKVPKVVSDSTRIQALQPEPARQAHLIPRLGGGTVTYTLYRGAGAAAGRWAGRNPFGGCCHVPGERAGARPRRHLRGRMDKASR